MRLLVRDWRKRLRAAKTAAGAALNHAALHEPWGDVDARLADCSRLGSIEALAVQLAEETARIEAG